MEDVIEKIENATDFEMDTIIDAIVCRYARVYPDWEVMFLSVPQKNIRERKKALRELIEWFENDLRKL